MNNAISINNGDSRHEIKIENGKMGSTGALNQKHDQGYAEGVEFKYGFISSTEGTSDRASRIRKWYALRGTKIEYWSVESDHVQCWILTILPEASNKGSCSLKTGTRLTLRIMPRDFM